MVIFLVLVLVAVVVGVIAVRRRRRVLLAGLNGSRPVFQIEPPSRRMNKRKHEAL